MRLEAGEISAGHGRAIISVEDAELQQELLKEL